MYKNSYQYGKYVPLFNIQNKDTLKNWSFHGQVKKAYDKSCKSFVLLFDHSTKAQTPTDTRAADLYLVQPYLLLQLMVTDKKLFHLEITITDQQRIKRRLILAAGTAYSSQRDNIIKQPLHARIPCDMIREGIWLNLQIDVQSFVDACFGQINFRSIDSIMIGGACRLRKVLTMKNQIIDGSSLYLEREYGEEVAQMWEEQFGTGNYNDEEVPGPLNFQTGIDYMNQVVSYDKILYWGYLMDQIHLSNSGSGDKKFKVRPDIAFGTRITTKPILEEQQRIKQALSQVKGSSPKGGYRSGSPEERQYSPPGQMSKATAGTRFQPDQSVMQIGNNPMRHNSMGDEQYKGSPMVGHKRQNPSHQESNTNFSQYTGSPQKSTMRGHGQPRNNPNMPNIDDHYLNEKLKYIQQQRLVIHQLAAKHGIPNHVRIETLSLISTPSGDGHHRRHDSASYLSLDPKERIREYNDQVNERRKHIHARVQEKKRQEAILNPPSPDEKELRRKRREEAQKKQQEDREKGLLNEDGSAKQEVSAWNEEEEGKGEGDGDEEYGEEGGGEQANGEKEDDEYGEEGAEKEQEAEEYGEENPAEANEEEGGEEYGNEQEAEEGEAEAEDEEY